MTRNPQNRWTSDALQEGNVEAIRDRVLQDAVYLTGRDYIGDTPLQTAIGFGNLELVEFMLQHGADPNVAVEDGYTCLLTAVESDDPQSIEIVERLIAAGADIHQTGINGWTPLHMAAARGHAEKARLLIRAGANVNQQTEIDGGDTPLMEAALNGKPDIVKLLLENGADPTIRNWITNRTALETAHYTAAGPDPDVLSYLKEKNISVDVQQMFAGMEMPVEQLKAMKALIGNVDLAESYAQRAKKLVESGDHAEVIRVLSRFETG